jgi:hypothetical protein
MLKSTRRLCLVLPISLLAFSTALAACEDSSSSPPTTQFDAGSSSFETSTPDTSAPLDSSSPVDSSQADSPTDAAADANPNVAFADLSPAFGTALTLQNATATYSQTTFGQFTIGKAIDGLDNNGLGWGISPQEATPQTAAFETSVDTAAQTGGTRLLFILDHTLATEHALGRFRISYTTADRSLFADGNEGTATPGDVGAAGIWNVLTPRRIAASNGATMTVLGDSSILVEDKDSTDAVYRIEADAPVAGITGFRLEPLKDASLPMMGPGLQNSNGNFCLTELTVRVGGR